MLPGSAPLLLLLGLSTAACFELPPEGGAPRRARFSANSPSEFWFQVIKITFRILNFICFLFLFTVKSNELHEILVYN